MEQLAEVVYCNTITGILTPNAYGPQICDRIAFEVLTRPLMDAKNSINDQNNGSERSISDLKKRKTRIVPVTLRLPKWWLKRVVRIARELSIRHHEDVSHCDLIRDIVYSAYVQHPMRTVFPTSCRMCQRRLSYEENVKLLEMCLK